MEKLRGGRKALEKEEKVELTLEEQAAILKQSKSINKHLSLNVEESDSECYADVIEDIVRKATKYKKLGEYKDIYELPCQVAGEEKVRDTLFSVLVGTKADGSEGVKLKIRGDNLYLVAYAVFGESTDDEKLTWFEFKSDEKFHYVPKSTHLGYKGDYGDLAAYAGRGILGMEIGMTPLFHAVETLRFARKGPTPNITGEARALTLLIVMFPEAVRFKGVSQFVVEKYERGGVPIDREIACVVNDWERMSDVVSGTVVFSPSDLAYAKKWIRVAKKSKKSLAQTTRD